MVGRQWKRFSLRALLGTITLFGLALAAWKVCEQLAVRDVTKASGGWSPRVIAPYILSVEKSDNITVVATYHVWCFGMVCDLPYLRRFGETGGLVISGVRPRIIIEEDEQQSLGIPE